MWIRGGDFFDLLLNVKKHRLANNIPVSLTWEAEVEDQLCRMLPAGFCRERQPGQLPINVSTRLSLDDLRRGTQVFVHWALSGAPTVDQQTADARGQVCASCYLNVPGDVGCRTCGSVINMVKRAVGSHRTSADPYLRNCAICKCSLAAKVWFPIDRIAPVTPEVHMQQFPEFCWVKKEILEMRKEANYVGSS